MPTKSYRKIKLTDSTLTTYQQSYLSVMHHLFQFYFVSEGSVFSFLFMVYFGFILGLFLRLRACTFVSIPTLLLTWCCSLSSVQISHCLFKLDCNCFYSMCKLNFSEIYIVIYYYMFTLVETLFHSSHYSLYPPPPGPPSRLPPFQASPLPLDCSNIYHPFDTYFTHPFPTIISQVCQLNPSCLSLV